MPFHLLSYIAVGGALGAVIRFLVSTGIYSWFGRELPHGTLFVNVSGSFLIGFLTELMLQRFQASAELRAALVIGFLGAYTTFSTFAFETFYLVEQQAYLKALTNILLSVGLCVTAVWFGQIWGRTIFSFDQIAPGTHFHAYVGLLMGWALLFLIGILLSVGMEFFELSVLSKIVSGIVLLGFSTVLSTLWMSLRLSSMDLELGEIFTLFALNATFAGSAIWASTKLGNWLWHHALLRS